MVPQGGEGLGLGWRDNVKVRAGTGTGNEESRESEAKRQESGVGSRVIPNEVRISGRMSLRSFATLRMTTNPP
jgi:hypothetical protein